MKNSNNNSNHERNGPEHLNLLKVPSSTPTTPTTPNRGLEDVFREMPITEETACGIWCFQGPNLQRFANKKAYVFLYGVLGCIFSASYAYFNGTITTIEKRFKIPSKTTGLITVGNDISQLFVSLVLSYYAGRGHRPRWIAVGIYTVVAFCCMTMLPHFMYGPGEDTLLLTKEYSSLETRNSTIFMDKQRRNLCISEEGRGAECEEAEGNFAPQLLLFMAQLISGVGGSLHYTLGVSYMDDNIQKSKTPALISFSYFLRMLGPAIGYGLVSFALKFYISPTLTPTITTQDPRWLGAWWLGWIILAILLFIFASIIALFPKTLPRAAARKALALEKSKSSANFPNNPEGELPASISDMLNTFKRLLTNTTLMCNNLATVFYYFGHMPYTIFMPKYIETQYKQSASLASLITGTVGLVFSASGIILSGLVISKYKPKARYLAAWNVIIGAVSVMGMVSYAFLGCPANDNQISFLPDGEHQAEVSCNEHCACDYVTYNPVCSEDGHTYISACHAGCSNLQVADDGSKIFTECSCVKPKVSQVLSLMLPPNVTMFSEAMPLETTTKTTEVPTLGTALPGSCSVDCMDKFYIFLAVVCLLKFSRATGKASNFLVSVRCVEEKDKTVAMGFELTIMCLFAFIPSPILFGYIMDNTCLVWGETCSGTGNCWLYNGKALRYLLNFTAASFGTIGTIFDVGVWYFIKDVKIFDEEIELEDIAEDTADAMCKTVVI